MKLSGLLESKGKIDDILLAISLPATLLAVYLGAITADDATATIIGWIPGVLLGSCLEVVIFKVLRPIERFVGGLLN